MTNSDWRGCFNDNWRLYMHRVFSIECPKTKPKPIRLLNQPQTVIKSKPSETISDYFQYSMENRSNALAISNM